tara:strand:+ start:1131 stop:1940 length:810 start_codon:yes stop_codon:yes gene_type:complete
MGFLNIHNNSLSGNTLRMYLSDYGKAVLTSEVSLLDAIEKFGLSDSDIDYRRFTGNGSCVDAISVTGDCGVTGTSVSALTGSCFYDLPDSRGGNPLVLSGDYGTLASVMIGPTFEMKKGNIKFYNTSVGSNYNHSTLWSAYQEAIPHQKVEIPASGMKNSCWSFGGSVTSYFPSYCLTCADFNEDGYVDINDFKTFLSFMGNETKNNELVGDFDGDGVVGVKDLNSFLRCLGNNGENILEYCKDEYVFCMLCDSLGKDSPCNGDCITCI